MKAPDAPAGSRPALKGVTHRHRDIGSCHRVPGDAQPGGPLLQVAVLVEGGGRLRGATTARARVA